MAVTVLIATVSQAKPWNQINDPARFDTKYDYHLNAFETKGSLPADKTPWSETYWPADKGGINYRWNAKIPTGFKYKSPTMAQAMAMTRAQLAELAPSEKYDLAMGHYNYPVRADAGDGAKRSLPYWQGICDGWTMASLQFPEPLPTDIKNPDGIMIPFGSSDVKGLLSYYMRFEADVEITEVGENCASKIDELLGTEACKDMNPGAMHVILTNQIGGKKEGFAAEVDPGHEVWNQPVFGYEFEILGSAKSKFSKNAVRAKMKMIYADELPKSSWEPVIGTPNFQRGEKDYEYILELDADGKITGGEWISKDHPDLFWKANSQPEIKGTFSGLNQIYKSRY